jgi:Family of unknown function (DUF5808)
MNSNSETNALRRGRGATDGLRLLSSAIGIALAVASIVRELRLPPARRTWHGMLLGRIPYDWRLPTLQRVANTFWRPGDRHLLQPTVFGVGWSINLAAVFHH